MLAFRRLNTHVTLIGALLAVGTIACGRISLKGEKKQGAEPSESDDSEKAEDKVSAAVGSETLESGLNLVLPKPVLDEASKPYTPSKDLLAVLEQSKKDDSITMTCDKDTGKVKGLVYIALYQRDSASTKGDEVVKNLATSTIESLNMSYAAPLIITQGGISTSSSDGAVATNQTRRGGAIIGVRIGRDRSPSSDGKGGATIFAPLPRPCILCTNEELPILGKFVKNWFDERKDAQNIRELVAMKSLRGTGVLLPYTCETKSTVQLKVRNKPGVQNVYIRTYTVLGKATHEGLSANITEATKGIGVELAPLYKQVDVTVTTK